MGKHKHPRPLRPQNHNSRISKPTPKTKPKKEASAQLQNAKPTIPFHPSFRILLIGEGDLSFSRSLIAHHACKDVTATVYESSAELYQKYPHVAQNIEAVEEGGGKIRYGCDCTKPGLGLGRKKGGGRGESWDRIVFNFPHVGGKTKDVNRQVRYNQGLSLPSALESLPS